MDDSQGRVPVVSVIVPAYKVAGMIGETLDSLMAQTFQDFEVIVINDGSPDTVELEKALEPYRSRIRYIKQANTGVSGARNTGLRHARGEFVALLDGDDSWMPDYLEKQVAALRADPSVSVMYSDAVIFGSTPFAGRRYMEINPSVKPVTTESLLMEKSVVLTCGSVIRRQALADMGYFDDKLTHCEDFDLWLRMTLAGHKIDFITDVVGRRRLGGLQSANTMACLNGAVRVCRKLAGMPGVTPELAKVIERQIGLFQSRVDLAMGKKLLGEGKYSEAAEALDRANAVLKQPKLTLLLWTMKISPALARTVSGWWNGYLTRKTESKMREAA